LGFGADFFPDGQRGREALLAEKRTLFAVTEGGIQKGMPCGDDFQGPAERGNWKNTLDDIAGNNNSERTRIGLQDGDGSKYFLIQFSSPLHPEDCMHQPGPVEVGHNPVLSPCGSIIPVRTVRIKAGYGAPVLKPFPRRFGEDPS